VSKFVLFHDILCLFITAQTFDQLNEAHDTVCWKF